MATLIGRIKILIDSFYDNTYSFPDFQLNNRCCKPVFGPACLFKRGKDQIKFFLAVNFYFYSSLEHRAVCRCFFQQYNLNLAVAVCFGPWRHMHSDFISEFHSVSDKKRKKISDPAGVFAGGGNRPDNIEFSGIQNQLSCRL